MRRDSFWVSFEVLIVLEVKRLVNHPGLSSKGHPSQLLGSISGIQFLFVADKLSRAHPGHLVLVTMHPLVRERVLSLKVLNALADGHLLGLQ